MMNVSRALGALVLAALPLALLGAGQPLQIPTPSGAAIIYSPGDGDFTGFLIVVERSGQAWASDGAGEGAAQVPALAQQLFADLAGVPPWQLPVRACPASQPDMHGTSVWLNAAVNRTTTVRSSPNLTCASDPRAERLLTDAASIRRALYVQAYRVRPMMVFSKTGGYVTGASQPAGGASYVSSGSCGCGRFTLGGAFTNGGAFNNGGTFSGKSETFNSGTRFSIGSTPTSGTLSGGRFSGSGRFDGTVRFDSSGRFSNGGTFDSGRFNSGSGPTTSPSPTPSS